MRSRRTRGLTAILGAGLLALTACGDPEPGAAPDVDGQADRLHDGPQVLVRLFHELRELALAAPDHAEAALVHEVLVLLGVVDLLQRGDERLLRRRRDSLRRRDHAPRRDLPVGAELLLERRHVRIERGRVRIHDRQRPDFAAVDHRARLRDRARHHFDAARDQILQPGRRALRGHPRQRGGIGRTRYGRLLFNHGRGRRDLMWVAVVRHDADSDLNPVFSILCGKAADILSEAGMSWNGLHPGIVRPRQGGS